MIRSLGLSLIAATSLLACTDTGAHLTLSAPDGPSNAKTFQVVLASPDLIPAIRNQRLAAGDPSTTDVSYFLQRTIAGAESKEIDDLDGFTVRIAPEGAVAETRFIPFVLLYDGNGRIEAIGTYRAGDAPPSAIRVATDVIDKYVINVEKVTELEDDSLELQPGEVRVITCFHDDQTTYTSGLVWRTAAGQQYRLLLPNDGGLDATGRSLDMDCDDHEVTVDSSHRDCDDTRSNYNRDASDVCDGEDTNCDGARTIASDCSLSIDCQTPFGTKGVQLCSDETAVVSDCQPTATCGCDNGTIGGGCHFCMVPVETSQLMPNSTSVLHPCQPAIGTLATPYCSDTDRCDVEVVGVRGGWKIEISAASTNAFGTRAYDVGGQMAIKAKRPEGAAYEQTATTRMPVADIDLAFITDDGTFYTALQLRLDENLSPNGCAVAPAIPMLLCY